MMDLQDLTMSECHQVTLKPKGLNKYIINELKKYAQPLAAVSSKYDSCGFLKSQSHYLQQVQNKTYEPRRVRE